MWLRYFVSIFRKMADRQMGAGFPPLEAQQGKFQNHASLLVQLCRRYMPHALYQKSKLFAKMGHGCIFGCIILRIINQMCIFLVQKLSVVQKRSLVQKLHSNDCPRLSRDIKQTSNLYMSGMARFADAIKLYGPWVIQELDFLSDASIPRPTRPCPAVGRIRAKRQSSVACNYY